MARFSKPRARKLYFSVLCFCLVTIFLSLFFFFSHGVCSAAGYNLNVTEWITMITELQTIFISEGSQIPMLYGMDSVHGAVFVDGATFFPQQIGAGATFNRDLVHQMGAITAKDSRLVGMPWVFAPILDLCTEPRWARVYEVGNKPNKPNKPQTQTSLISFLFLFFPFFL